MKKFLSMLAISVLAVNFWACDDDDPAPDPPTISSPSITNVLVSTGADISFTVTTPGGYRSSAVAATGGTATIASQPTAGANSGTVVVTFTADANAGAGGVTLTVTDNNSRTSSQTAVINKTPEPIEETEITVSANISADVTWETGKTYILAGRIAVTNGATLTIEPGVIVKGEAGTGTNATALIVARGSMIMAEGTAEQPIIFTSVADEIEPGMVASPNLDPDIDGLWGGLIVLGSAPISVSTNEQNFQIEGIPASDPNGAYGGNDAEDNSGVLRYISIRHGGANIGEGNEINGLTLGGVGSGTVIEYVEVIANQDDGIEWFGGTVNVSHAVVWNSGDDALDTDQAWAGTMDNFVILCGDATDHALEIDGPEGSLIDGHTIRNGSVKGNEASEMGDFRDGIVGTFENIYFFGFPDPAAGGRGDFALSGAESIANFGDGSLAFAGLQTTLPAGVALTSVFLNGTHVHATNVAAGENTVGANLEEFAGWSWTAVSGALEDF